MTELTHINLHSANTADRSRIQISGDYDCAILAELALTEYFYLAALTTFKMGFKNFPSTPSVSLISLCSVMLFSICVYYSISASFPPVISARSSSSLSFPSS